MEYSVVVIFAASDLGLHCLHMSHKRDARLIWEYIKAFPAKMAYQVTIYAYKK